jgi:hypothetical protein
MIRKINKNITTKKGLEKRKIIKKIAHGSDAIEIFENKLGLLYLIFAPN